MTLWIFGDSFASPTTSQCAWPTLLAHALGTAVENLGVNGSSLDYLYNCYEQHHAYMNPGDHLVMCFTALARQNFFPTKPGATSNLTAVRHDISPEENQALMDYFKYLYNEINMTTHAVNFLHRLNVESAHKGLKVLIIACFEQENVFLQEHSQRFENLGFASGYLNHVSDGEFDETGRGHIRRHFYYANDWRPNHICHSNHKILFSKINQYFLYGTGVDLTSGFVTGLVTVNSLLDPGFRAAELTVP